ncbi:hypothetical protein [Roseiconus lacunae]|uniref:Glycosyltransferase family 1 protein n=1 Tax=Roseiconus lacunae TaxID=2605694 RepID=A0ABT7PCQ3_9BACT|nr:hypothetical protein [Roseiconus lacunae]MDM4014280.1 hypothetical protein [Roseiconus lacunae]
MSTNAAQPSRTRVRESNTPTPEKLRSDSPCDWQSRILFVDDNVRSIGGHYLELASLLAEGASELGYGAVLASHRSFGSVVARHSDDPRLSMFQVDSRFTVRRMENWSLGIDGPSRCKRDLTGRPVGSSPERLRQKIADWFCRPGRRPSRMIEQWSDQFYASLVDFRPRRGDVVVVNTAGDFQMLALARAMKRFESHKTFQRCQIHAVFHFAVYEGRPDWRSIQFGDQVNASVAAIRNSGGHRIQIHATTEPLRNQLRRVGISATAIDYPTRPRAVPPKTRETPVKVLLAGLPRAEKGRDEIRRLLQAIEPEMLRSGRMQVSLQCDPRRWQRVIPKSLQDVYHAAVSGIGDDETAGNLALEIKLGNLSSDDYHRWLDTADIGLFLYDAKRYVARCSGVLLEMLIRGSAVIVPEGCWLADQVRLAETHPEGGKIGWVYRSIDELPSLMRQATDEIAEVRESCKRYAARITRRHSGTQSLLAMGVRDLRETTVERAA